MVLELLELLELLEWPVLFLTFPLRNCWKCSNFDVFVAWASTTPTFPEPWARPAPSRRAHGCGIVGIVGMDGIAEVC